MGIKNLTSIIKHNAPNGISKVHLSEYRGRVIAIDTSIYLYKYMYNGNYLNNFVKQILRLLRNNITPLYIFDGKPPEQKKEILEDRKHKKDQLVTKKKELEDMLENIVTDVKDTIQPHSSLSSDIVEEEITNKLTKDQLEFELKKVSKKIIKITHDDITNLKTLFELFGIHYITSDGEAEDLCSHLCQAGLVYGCMSEDTDILANGGMVFIRDFNSNNDYITEYKLNVILDSLDFTYTQFVDMCILCGCDYTSKIYGIGPINAYKYINEYKTIETIITNIESGILKKHKIPETFDYNKARELFKQENTTEYNKDFFKRSPINKYKLSQFIKKECELGDIYLSAINKL